jgi:hypothetical protein
MARRMMSAAAPWIGALMAARSPNWRSALGLGVDGGDVDATAEHGRDDAGLADLGLVSSI